MAIAIFTWCPRLSANASTKFSVRQAQMGDGYMQVSSNGLNPRSQEWSLEFTGNAEYIAGIKSFLDGHKGFQAFSWQPPLESLGLYRCDEYSPTALGNNIYSFSATFKTAYGLATESQATIAPIITTQPLNLNVMEGAGATFSVVAAGTQPFTYKWEKSTNGTSWAQIATTQQFTITQTTLADTSFIRVTVTNAYGNAVSQTVNLNVQEQPVIPIITSQPVQNTEILTGGTVVLSAAGSGSGTLRWLWQKQNGSSWMNVGGAETNVLTIPAVEVGASGLYRAILSNDVGQVISANASVTVNEHIIDLTQDTLPSEMSYTGPAKFYRAVSDTLSQTPSNVWAVEYEGNTRRGRSLPQPAIANLLKSPFDLSTSDWSANRATNIQGQSSPDNNLNAVSLIPTAVNGTHYVEQSFPKDNSADYTFSVFIKAAGLNYAMIQIGNVSYQTNPQSIYINLIDGTVNANDPSRVVIKAYANGWYRVSTTITTNTSGAAMFAQIYASSGLNTGSETFTGDAIAGISLWGAMVQKTGLPLRALPVGLSSAAESASVAKNYGASRFEMIFSNGARQMVDFGNTSTTNLPVETLNWQDRFISGIRYMA